MLLLFFREEEIIKKSRIIRKYFPNSFFANCTRNFSKNFETGMLPPSICYQIKSSELKLYGNHENFIANYNNMHFFMYIEKKPIVEESFSQNQWNYLHENMLIVHLYNFIMNFQWNISYFFFHCRCIFEIPIEKIKQ